MANPTQMASDLAAKREAGNGTNLPAKQEPVTVTNVLARNKPQIAAALPTGMSAERFARVALTAVRMTPALQKCHPMSLLAACMQAAQLGLEPGPLAQCYLVPYGDQVQFIIGPKGIIELAHRTGMIQTLVAREVYENDEFSLAYGVDEEMTHRPALTDRGELIGVYAVAKYKDGGHTILFLSRADVDKFRKRSKVKNGGPWSTDYGAMARKTVLKQLAKYMPLSVEVARSLAADGTVPTQLTVDLADTPAYPDGADRFDDDRDDGVVDAEIIEDEPSAEDDDERPFTDG